MTTTRWDSSISSSMSCPLTRCLGARIASTSRWTCGGLLVIFLAGKSHGIDLIELAIKTASTAPSGAHLQPWTFVAVSNGLLQKRIRDAAEKEERQFYEDRVPEAWSEVLRPLGTDHIKAHLTDAPWVVILFRQSKRARQNGEMGPTYYSQESCGIAAGLFIAAVHNMGLTTLTHTPSPMGFLREILNRPDHEHAMLVMPVGYPADDAKVPQISRKDRSNG